MKPWLLKRLLKPRTQAAEIITRQRLRYEGRRAAFRYLGVGTGTRPVFNESRRVLRRIALGMARRKWKELRAAA